MSGIIVTDRTGQKISYFGTQFDQLEALGTKYLRVKTGSNASDVVKYALTSTPLNDKYKKLKIRLPANANGSGQIDAYIAQRYSISKSLSISSSYTTTTSSNWTSSITLSTASKSSLSTRTATKTSKYTSSQTLKTNSSSKLSTNLYTTTASCSLTKHYGALLTTSTYKDFSVLLGKESIIASTSIRGYIETISSYENIGNPRFKTIYVTAMFTGNNRTLTVVNPTVYLMTRQETSTSVNRISSRTLSTASKSSLSTKTATRTSKYTSSQTLKTVSKSSLSTKLTTRSSQYSTSKSTSSTNSIITNNVNL